jgi:hypothetical protein
MPQTETPEAQILGAFSRRRRNQLLLLGALMPITIGALLYQRHVVGTVLGMPAQLGAPIFLVLVVGSVLFSLWNWRCPACGGYLGRSLNPKYCPSCGVRLRA